MGRAQPHRHRQGYRRQHTGHGILPPGLGPQKKGRGEEDIQKYQPVFQVRVGEVQGVVGDRRQNPGYPEDIPGQQSRHETDHRPQGYPEEARQDCPKPQREHKAGGCQAQQVAYRRDQYQRPEVDSAQRHRECHGPHGGRQAGNQQSADLPTRSLPQQQVLELRRQPEKPRHGSEGQLQTDGGRRKGVRQQDQKQGGGQRGGRVAVPLKQGCRQHEHHHDAGPDHRGTGPGQQRIEHQDGQRQHRRQTVPVPSCEQQNQRHQKAAVHPGHRQDVAESRLRQVGPGFFRQSGRVPGEDGAEERGLISVKQRRHPVLHGPGRMGGPPPWRAGGSLTVDGFVSPLVGQQEHSLSGEVGNGILPKPGGILKFHLCRHCLSRLQVQQVRPAVADHLAQGNPLQLHCHLGAVVRGDGVLQKSHGSGALAAGQGRKRRPYSIAVQPVPPQGQGQPRAHQQHPLPPKSRQQQGEAGRGKENCRHGQKKPLRQQILGQTDPQSEGHGERGQLAHGLSSFPSCQTARPAAAQNSGQAAKEPQFCSLRRIHA